MICSLILSHHFSPLYFKGPSCPLSFPTTHHRTCQLSLLAVLPGQDVYSRCEYRDTKAVPNNTFHLVVLMEAEDVLTSRGHTATGASFGPPTLPMEERPRWILPWPVHS
jgi:hypothetical protein